MFRVTKVKVTLVNKRYSDSCKGLNTRLISDESIDLAL